MPNEVSIVVQNDRKRPHVIWIEPWGEDYTLLCGEQIKVSVASLELDSGACFHLVETEGNTQVYVEHSKSPRVLVNNSIADCGHNRQAAIDAGIYPD